MITLRSKNAILWLLLLASFSGSILSVRRLDHMRPHATLQEVLYVPSPTVLKRLSLGYNALLADVYWTRVVQYFGSKHVANSMEYRLLYPLLDIATRLDPHLIPAYDFGSVFLAQKIPAGAGDPHGAVALLDRGIQENPKEWRLYQDLGFIYYVELKDYAAAGKAFYAGAQIPGAHPFLKVIAARTLQHGGDFQTSQLLWRSVYESSNDVSVRKNALKHLRALQVDEAVATIEQAIEIFKKRNGRLPGSLAELVSARILSNLPRDPRGYPYELLPNGHVQVHDYLELPYITKGLPPGQQPSDFDLSSNR
jgi:tetratricopeptide (TPR) repeat protein